MIPPDRLRVGVLVRFAGELARLAAADARQVWTGIHPVSVRGPVPEDYWDIRAVDEYETPAAEQTLWLLALARHWSILRVLHTWCRIDHGQTEET